MTHKHLTVEQNSLALKLGHVSRDLETWAVDMMHEGASVDEVRAKLRLFSIMAGREPALAKKEG